MSSVREWIHTPRYLLRRNLILHLLRGFEPGAFLEIGCGRGELLPWLAELGFQGAGLEISPEASEVARSIAAPHRPGIEVYQEPDALRGRKFRYVFAFEVLEHIEDDRSTLREWRNWLEPGGRLVISVPAHMSKWSAADEVGGHYRRYERRALEQLLTDCGYEVETLWSYGFPVTSLTSRVRGLLYRSRLVDLESADKQQRTLQSSFHSTGNVGRGARWLNPISEVLARMFHLLQLPARRFDVGDGYLVACRVA